MKKVLVLALVCASMQLGAMNPRHDSRYIDESLINERLQRGLAHCGNPLIVAIRSGNLNEAKRLITEGTLLDVPDHIGDTALMYAAMGHRQEIARMLIDNGAQLDLQNYDGHTALKTAAVFDQEIARMLIDALLKQKSKDIIIQEIQSILWLWPSRKQVVQELINYVNEQAKHGPKPMKTGD